jgi:hypothetical protein
LLVGDNLGHMKLISARDGELIQDLGKVHDDQITGIMRTADKKFFFTSTFDGKLKQWNYEDNTLIRDHGKIMNTRIWSLCL